MVDEGRQALRMRRYLMAAGTSLMVIVLLFLAYLLDGLAWTGFVQGTALISFWVAVFYVAIRSGLNLKLSDPSLTIPQLYTSVLTMAYIMYYADRGRGALLVVYLVAFLFGVFRLRVGQLLVLAGTTILAYGVLVLALYRFKPGTVDAPGEILQLIVLALTLPVVCPHGGLRDQAARRHDRGEPPAPIREEGGRSRGGCEERLPRQHEPRNPHAHERRHRHDRPAAGHRPDRRAARIRRDDPRAAATALLTIINDILDFSKIEAGKLELDLQPFDPAELHRGRARDRRARRPWRKASRLRVRSTRFSRGCS